MSRRSLHVVLILICTLSLVTSTRAQMRLIYYDTLQDDNHINKICMLDAAEGYIAFTRFIGYTTDSGRHYNKKFITLANVDYNGFAPNLTFGFGIRGVVALSRDTILAYGDYGFVPSILYSTNGGNTYKLIYHDQFNPQQLRYGIADMVFPGNGAVGYAVDCDRILKTTDRGRNWVQVYAQADRFLQRISAPDRSTVYVFGTEISRDVLLRTTNAGSSWATVNQPNADRLSFAFFLTPTKGYIRKVNANYKAGLYFTNNGGGSWRLMNNVENIPTPQGEDMIWLNDSTAYALGDTYNTYKTTDSGKIWEYLPRDNNYEYLAYNHENLFTIGQQLVWSGGLRGVLEISTNGGGTTLPAAFMKVDTTGLHLTGTVNLINYSKTSYTFKWFKNNVLLATTYNASYTHDIFKLSDTLRLVAIKGSTTDTVTWIQYYPQPVVVSGFTPVSAATGDDVLISGINFVNVRSVSFGGRSALQYTVLSPTQIRAKVGSGASGVVRVETDFNYGFKSGFTYVLPPTITIPVSIADSVLCKSEQLRITIEQTEADVRYDLIDSANAIKGTIQGNGGTVQLVTVPINYNGRFRIKAYRLNTSATAVFDRFFTVAVEKTLSRFAVNRVNAVPGQTLQFHAISRDASFYNWKFNEDASIPASVAKRPSLSYVSAGVKTLVLISESINGCKDTLNSVAVGVYNPFTGGAAPFAMHMDSTNNQFGQVLGNYTATADNGLLVIGASYPDGKIRSRAGISYTIGPSLTSYLVKYSAHGVVEWVHWISPAGTNDGISAVQTDALGNIYMAGYANSLNWLHFANGDSLRFWVKPSDTVPGFGHNHGFFMKLDPDGNYLWHTLLYDQAPTFPSNPDYPGVISSIKIRGQHIYLSGDFLAKLLWVRNGVQTLLYNLNESPDRQNNQNKFILRIASDGQLKWKTYLDYNAGNNYGLGEPDIDASGNLYVAGYHEDAVRFYDKDSLPAMTLIGTNSRFRGFQMKLDSNGKLSWYNSYQSDYQYGNVKLGTVKVDDAGNSYLTGDFFNWGIPGKPIVKHSNGTESRLDSLTAFGLVKLDSSGKVRWSVGTRYPYGGGGAGLVLDQDRVFSLAKVTAFQQDLAAYKLSATNGYIRNFYSGQNELLLIQYDTAGVFKKLLNSGYQFNSGSLDTYTMTKAPDGNFIVGVNKGVFGNGPVIASYFNIPVPGPYARSGGGLLVKLDPRTHELPVAAQAGPDRTKCPGDTSRLGSVTSTGALYSWTSVPAGFISDIATPVVQPMVTTMYILTVANDGGGLQVKDTVVITVLNGPLVNAGADTLVCPGQPVTIGTSAIPGLTYNWTSDRPDNFTSALAQPVVQYSGSAYYYLRVTNATGCRAYDTVYVQAGTTAPVVASIAVSQNPVCKDSLVIFTGGANNGGTNPIYRWQVNGKDAYLGRIYNTDTLKNGDQIRVITTTSNRCSTRPVDTSAVVVMNITPTAVPAASISGNTTVDSGQAVTLSATYTLPGTVVSFKWEDSTRAHSWLAVPSATTPNITYTPKNTGDKLRFVYYTSVACASANTIYSTVRFTLNPLVPTAVGNPALALGIRIFPNPVQKVLYLDGLKLADQWRTLSLTDLSGKPVQASRNITGQTRLEVPVSGLAAGTYFGVLRDKNGRAVYFRWLKVH